MQQDRDLEKAKNYAFLLLKFRPRSEKEILFRLKKKRFADFIIKQTLAFLKEKDFLNDIKFSRAWIESRLKKPLGLRRIKEELRQKGIDKQIIEKHLREIKKNYSEKDIVTEIVCKKLRRLKEVEPQKAKRRIFSYLLRRGFSPDVVIELISNMKNNQLPNSKSQTNPNTP